MIDSIPTRHGAGPCEEYHKTQQVHTNLIRNLETDVANIKREIEGITSRIDESGERQKFHIKLIESMKVNISNLEQNVNAIKNDYASLKRDVSETRDTVHQISIMTQTGHDLLNAHIGTETLQYREYVESYAKLQTSMDKLNSNLFKALLILLFIQFGIAIILQRFEFMQFVGSFLGI